MASIFYNIICPNIGAAWVAALAKWVEVVVDDTNTLAQELTTSLGMKALQIRVTIGADTHFYNHCCADLDATGTKVPLPYVLSAPGWRTMPKVLSATYGTRNTKTSFDSIMHIMRGQIATLWCGATEQHQAITTNTFTGVTGVTQYEYQKRYKCVLQSALDAYSLTTKDGTATVTFAADAQTTDGLLAGQPTIALGGGGSEIDLDPVVAALQDIAMIDVDYTANNGKSIFSMRGRVNAGL